jgi:hypothetical protein
MRSDEFVTKVIEILRSKRVDFLIHGAIAMGLYGYNRATEDLDIIISTGDRKVLDALSKKGFRDIKVQMTEEGMVHKLAYNSWYLDIFLEDGRAKWLGLKARAKKVKWGKYTVKVISKKDLIKFKERRASFKDMLDIHVLKNMRL